jgi:GNAT superfamily N-acetyltransferase
VEVCPLADPSLLRGMATRDYRPVSFRNVYGHELGELGPTSDDIEISVVEGEDDVVRWSETILDGFGFAGQDDRARVGWWNRMLAGLPHATLVLALRGGRPVGAAILLVHGGTASLGGTATRVDHRRQGVQAALLAARLRMARAAGCSLAVVTADPGGTSARNCERAGFQLAYTNVRFRAANA